MKKATLKLNAKPKNPQDESMNGFLGIPHTPIEKDKLNYKLIAAGILNEYMGRYCNCSDRIECFYPHEENLLKKFISILKEIYPNENIILEKEASGHLNVKNQHINADINFSYYRADESVGCACDENGANKSNSFTLFIKNDIFKSHIDKISYIYGCYLRGGKINGKNITFNFANSLNKYEILANLLAGYTDKVTKTRTIHTIPTCLTLSCNSKYLTDLLLTF